MGDAAIIMLTGALVASSCALLGSFLVLRKSAMIGDAISHAVLPGIAIAYLFSGTRDIALMLLAAGIFGMLTTFIIEILSKFVKLKNDAAIGLTFTTLFAIGVILITKYASSVDLDQDCVLYGDILFVPLTEKINLFSLSIPISTFALAIVFLLNIFYLYFGYKGLIISTFNEEYARAKGISSSFWHYSLMTLVSLTTVVSFESVGAILVVAFFIVPAATAYLLTGKLLRMLGLSVFFGILSAVIGYYFALYLDSSVAGSMVTVGGIIFFLVFILKLLLKRHHAENLEEIFLKENDQFETVP